MNRPYNFHDPSVPLAGRHHLLAGFFMPEGAHRFRPFEDVPWPKDKASAAAVFWEWRDYLKSLTLPNADAYSDEARRLENGDAPQQLSGSLVEKIWRVSQEHKLPIDWFAAPLKASFRLHQPLRFVDAGALKEFLGEWVVPHASLIAKLAGSAHSWQLKQVNELATAFFLTDKLVHLPVELQEERLFIPESDLEQAGVTVEMLRTGDLNENVRKLLWKQAVRVRDAFAQGQPLLKDLDRRYRRPFKRNWLTGLEYVNEIERRKYDLWSSLIELSSRQRFQVGVLSWIGKGANQARGR